MILVLHMQSSPLVTVLRDTLLESNLTLSESSGSRGLSDLPPASLQRFLRARNQSSGGISNFKGYVLATYDQNFTNRFVHNKTQTFFEEQGRWNDMHALYVHITA